MTQRSRRQFFRLSSGLAGSAMAAPLLGAKPTEQEDVFALHEEVKPDRVIYIRPEVPPWKECTPELHQVLSCSGSFHLTCHGQLGSMTMSVQQNLFFRYYVERRFGLFPDEYRFLQVLFTQRYRDRTLASARSAFFRRDVPFPAVPDSSDYHVGTDRLLGARRALALRNENRERLLELRATGEVQPGVDRDRHRLKNL